MTWSIVVRDPETGQFGVAVASRFFAVGALCPWARSGVGAVSTQALVDPYWGPRALALIEAGVPATVAVPALAEASVHRAQRQLHAVGTVGAPAAYTGAECVDWAGHLVDADASVAGNMLAGPEVIEETLRAYLDSAGRPLAERLLRAMSAGDAAGGDKRGKQSVAVLVHGVEAYADVNLRVDDHPEPIAELWRIYQVGHERYYGFHSAMPTRADPDGVGDREVLEQRIQDWIEQHGNVDFSEYWSRDPWRD